MHSPQASFYPLYSSHFPFTLHVLFLLLQLLSVSSWSGKASSYERTAHLLYPDFLVVIYMESYVLREAYNSHDMITAVSSEFFKCYYDWEAWKHYQGMSLV